MVLKIKAVTLHYTNQVILIVGWSLTVRNTSLHLNPRRTYPKFEEIRSIRNGIHGINCLYMFEIFSIGYVNVSSL